MFEPDRTIVQLTEKELWQVIMCIDGWRWDEEGKSEDLISAERKLQKAHRRIAKRAKK